jgi:hypothetical protein
MTKDEANASPKDAALRLALEALSPDPYRSEWAVEEDKCKAITAIKAALKTKDEPVVWNEGVPAMLPKQKEGETFIVSYEPKLEAKDEPVAWISPTELLVMRGNALGGAKDWRVNVGLKPEDGDVGLYTSPPQRKPLTDEEIVLIVGECAATHQHTDIHFARAIEAAHGITGENT